MDKLFPLNLAKPTDELKELIKQYPDYPIVVLADETAYLDDYTYTYCSDIGFGVGRILDCEAICKDEKVYTDEDDFMEDMGDFLSEEYPDLSDDELRKLIDEKIAEYDSYWKDVIIIWVGN